MLLTDKASLRPKVSQSTDQKAKPGKLPLSGESFVKPRKLSLLIQDESSPEETFGELNPQLLKTSLNQNQMSHTFTCTLHLAGES